jgi:Zn-dependent oligopeptidase
MEVLLNYKDLTIEKLDEILAKYIDLNELINKTVLNLELSNLSWDNIVEPYVKLNNNYVDLAYFNMKQFHENETIREYASKMSVKLTQYNIDNYMRKDLYKINKYYYDNQYKLEKANLTTEQISYIEDAMLSYKKIGLDLPEDKYNRVKDIKKEISQLTTEYEQNIDNYKRNFEFNVKDVDGLPESFIKEHMTEDNKVKVTLDYPDYIPMMEYCNDRNIRKKLNFEFNCRAIDTNVEIAEKVFKLRQEIASLFSVENYSDYKLEDSMAGSTSTVMNFLDKLHIKIKPLLQRDYNILASYATEKIEPYDIAYYSRIHIEKESSLNKEELKKNFPVRQTIKNVFNIYQTLLSYTFEDITDMHKNTLWNDEVKLFIVKSDESTVGYFYLDLFPRDGKYGHAAVFPCINKSISTYPVAAMACNFAKDFMTLDELETFFHEFGHIMHHISSVSKISATASFSCEQDFVETPSQMFEEWVYTNKTLKIISPTITDDIINKIKKQRNMLQGYHYSRQLSFCYLDMNVHSKNYNHNSFETNKRITKEILGLDVQENTNSIASFGHLMGGYDAGYYGYLWSLVYATDLFTKFIGHELDPIIGKKFRDEVLSQGSIRKSIDSIKIFLQREPNENAFINSKYR